MVQVINLLMSAAILIPVLLATPALGDDALKRELVEGMSEIELPVLARYQELGLMHKQILITLQTLPAKEITSTTKKWVNIAAGPSGIIQKFDEINNLASGDDPGSHKTAMTRAIGLKSDIDSLKGYKQAKDNFITSYPETALQHFFADQGAYFETLAENATDTCSAIDHYEQALIAYREAADLTKTTYIDLKAKEIKSEYEFDMETLNESLAIGGAKFEQSAHGTDHAGNPIAVSIGVLASKRAGREFATVYEIYTKHGDVRASDIEEKIIKVGDIHSDLVGVFLRYAAAVVTAFVLFLVTVLSRLFRWGRAVEDTMLGNEVIR